MTDEDLIGNAREIRLAGGLSQADMAFDAGVADTAIGRWERGEREPEGRRRERYLRVLRSIATGSYTPAPPLPPQPPLTDTQRDRLRARRAVVYAQAVAVEEHFLGNARQPRTAMRDRHDALADMYDRIQNQLHRQGAP